LLERKERRGIEIEIEEAEKKRKPREDREIKTRDRYKSKMTLYVLTKVYFIAILCF
jgi:hypothetical protein